MKRTLITMLVLFLWCTPHVLAESIGVQCRVQSRIYEDGSEERRAGFQLYYEETGLYVMEDVVELDSVQWSHIDTGRDLTISGLNFTRKWWSYPGYDCRNGQWLDEELKEETSYGALIEEPLLAGTYEVTFEDNDGNLYDCSFPVNEIVNLPIISANSFEYRFDERGGFHWTWELPDELFYLDQEIETSVRALIRFYRDKTNMGWIQKKVPAHMGRVFVPNDVMEDLKGNYEKFDLVVQVRTNDGINRSYSNPEKLKFKK